MVKNVCSNRLTKLCNYSIILSILCFNIWSSPYLNIIPVGNSSDSGSYRIGTSGVDFRGTGTGLKTKHDGFIFAYSVTAGDCLLETSLEFFTDSLKISEAGLMFRSDTSDSALFCSILLLNEKGTYIKYRSSSGQDVRNLCISNSIFTKLRIKRTGTNFTFYYKSTSDSNWNSVNTIYNFNFPATLYAGLYHSTNNDTLTTGVRFSYINGLPDRLSSDTVCIPTVFDFNNGISLDSLGFINIFNWNLDTLTGTIISTLNHDSNGIASISTPQLQSEIGNDTLTVSWDLYIKADSTPPLNDYSLYSVESIDLSDRVKISGLRMGSQSQIRFGRDDTIYSDVYAGGKVILDDRTRVYGKVVTSDICSLGTGVYVSGTITQNTPLSFPSIPVRSFPTGVENKILEPNDSIYIVPGSYDSLRAGGASKIRFTQGDYFFKTFELQPEVKMYLDTDSSHRIDINVSGRTHFADRIMMVMNDSNAHGNVSLYTNSNDTVKFGTNLTLYGWFIIPNAVSHLTSRNVVIRGGIYAKKIKMEPDVSIYTIRPHIGINRFKVSFFPSDTTQPDYHLTYDFHRKMENDSINDIFLQRDNDTVAISSTEENTPLYKNLHFEQMFFPLDSGFASRLLYNSGNGQCLIFDSVKCDIANLDFLKFEYIQGSTQRQNIVHLDNISISCVNDSCPQLILIKGPSDTTVYEGSKVKFFCLVNAGKSNPGYQWLRNGIPVPATNSPEYVMQNVSLSDNGSQYQCRVTGVCGELLLTSNAILTVLECNIPEILSNPVSDTVDLGQSASFSVTVNGTDNNYQWIRNGNPIHGATGTIYTINSVNADNNMDRYCVFIKNGCGKEILSECATLTVAGLEPCKIIQHPENDTLVVNEHYRAEVQTVCKNGNYTWYKNNLQVVGINSQVLIYGPVTMQDNGAEFFCIADNGVALDTSKISRIIVRPPLDNSSSISISGELFDADDKRLEDSCLIDFQVKIFTLKSGGASLYTESQKNVIVRGGQFTLTLGRGTFSGDLQKAASANKELYAEIYAGEKGTMRIIAPRLRLTAAPYAMSSGLKVIYGNGNPDSSLPEAPLGTVYVDRNDGNRTWKLGKTGWVRLD